MDQDVERAQGPLENRESDATTREELVKLCEAVNRLIDMVSALDRQVSVVEARLNKAAEEMAGRGGAR